MGRKTAAVNIQEVARTAALEAIKIHKEEERQHVRKTRYHNTELLLKNYLNLLDHYENAKEKASDIIKLAEVGLDPDEDDVLINSIKRSRIRTLTFIALIENCLDILKNRMASKGQSEKYVVIYSLYLDKGRRNVERGELIGIIAQELSSSEPSVRRWKNEMVRELSILLFGIDGLRLDV